MAKRTRTIKQIQAGKAARLRPPRPPRPRAQALPGMEDKQIAPLEDLAVAYGDLRERRAELAVEERSLKRKALVLMEQFGKTRYHRDGLDIIVTPGDANVRFKVHKAAAPTPAEG